MFIIKAKDKDPAYGMEYYMSSIVNTSDLFLRDWNIIIIIETQRYASIQDAETFLNFIMVTIFNTLPQAHTSWWTGFDISICEIDNAYNIISEVAYTPFVMIGGGNVGVGYDSVDDGIDYDTPGEALKAYKRGKVVDWKRKAGKN